uniref:Uncharacterized protein n=1 Tax=Mycena chlorophos TaxID=658473 RepID=A0ABQ0KYP6_MYCCL|nr:predicted protein [Mycena chlorophos]
MVDYWVMESYEGASNRKQMTDALTSERDRLYSEFYILKSITDVSDALKHGRLAEISRHRDVANVEQLKMSKSFFNAPFGEGVFAEAVDFFLELDEGVVFSARRDLKKAKEFWIEKLNQG